MISKELLSEVLELKRIDEIYTEDNILYFCELNEGTNIYELAHKCKEWALSKGYYLRAEQGINYKDNLQWTCFLNKDMNDGADFVDYWNITEPEAIFKACEWILKEMQK